MPLVTDIEAEINETCYKFGIPKNKFKLLGFVEQTDLPALYRGANIFCYPSLYEGFGLPVLEAFNCGCSVVSSDNSSLKEIISEKNAFIFDLESDFSLAEKIWEGLENKEEREQRVKKARQDAKKFDWINFTKKVLSELKKMK